MKSVMMVSQETQDFRVTILTSDENQRQSFRILVLDVDIIPEQNLHNFIISFLAHHEKGGVSVHIWLVDVCVMFDQNFQTFLCLVHARGHGRRAAL